ncbi:unnamed protein product [Miscanthus lutarioriparius]|uniref:Mitochondrial import inner membrane translocase subunit TIM50 n=1 Tax=Miscanthus lutarioriparius TaxID=422564 RepID=A0A811P2F7_9POAL|nr:unnamed protein product [Miscanthus lutarioriparius]
MADVAVEEKVVEEVARLSCNASNFDGVLIDSARTCLNAPGLNTLENKVKLLVLKELKKLWDKEEPDLPWQQGEFSHSNTLLVDDSPYKALRNPPHTAIFPCPYSYKNDKDDALGSGGELRLYLESLATAEDVQR